MDELIYLIDSFDVTAARILADKELSNCGLTKENVEITLKSFQGDEIAASVFLKKYALRDAENQIIELTLDAARDRWATAIMEAENKFSGAKDSKYFRELYDYFLPGGRQMFGLGDKYLEKISLINCYVTAIEEDSIEGIYEVAKKIARTYSYGGGIGFCIGNLRPKDAKVSNSARYSTGAVSFMELFSLTTALIGQNGRRGALLCSIPVNHPDIEDFIEIKHNNIDKVKHANISVKLTDEFMNAVVSDQDFTLSFTTKHEVITKVVRAKDLWNKLVKSARDSAEPGLLFWDTMKKMSPSEIYEGLEVVSTNPCGEQILSNGDSCCLGSLLLHKFVLNPYTENAQFDFDKFATMVWRGVRHLDNIVEINLERHPLKEQGNIARKGRRIGLGLTGLADTLLALNLKYDTEEALGFIERLMTIKRNNEYLASIDLAKERGAFPVFTANHYDQSFSATLPENIKEMGRQFGQRNVAISTVAPNGSLSIMAQCSSGIEPVFALSYKRYVEMGGKKRKEFTIFHPGLVRYFHVTGEKSANEKWVVAHEVDYTSRIKLQHTIQAFTDASISSCLAFGNNLLLTSEGLLDIEELVGDTENKKFNSLPNYPEIASFNNKNNKSKITEVYNNGMAQTSIISFEGGSELVCTPNHKLEVLSENYSRVWKQVQDIKSGDVVIGRFGMRMWRQNSNIQLKTLLNKSYVYIKKTNSKDVTIPRRMSNDLARLIGYMCSDGCVGINGISLCQQVNNVCDDFERIVEKLFKIKCKRVKDERSENLINIVANSREISHFFTWLGITNHNKITVPLVIRRSGEHYIKEFIKGVTLDGYISKDKICVATSVSKKFLAQLQIILFNFGINAILIKSNNAGTRIFPSGMEYNTKDAWALLVCGAESLKYMEYIGFAEDRKVKGPQFVKPYRKSLYGSVPDFGIRKSFRDDILNKLGSNYLVNHFHSLTCKHSRNRKEIDRNTLLEFKDMGYSIPDFLIDDTFIFRKIVSIAEGPFVMTGDVSVPDGNSYIVNGFISHNTINLPNDVSEETVGQIYIDAWKNQLKGITVYREGSREGILITDEFEKFSVKPEMDTIIQCVKAEGGDKFYVMTSYKEQDVKKPYQIFVLNYKQTEKDSFIKVSNALIKMLKTKGVSDKRINKYVDRSKNSLERVTRFLSLSMKTDCLDDAVQVLDEYAFAGTLVSRLHNILNKSLKASKSACKKCGSSNVRMEEGCMVCLDCLTSGCG